MTLIKLYQEVHTQSHSHKHTQYQVFEAATPKWDAAIIHICV